MMHKSIFYYSSYENLKKVFFPHYNVQNNLLLAPVILDCYLKMQDMCTDSCFNALYLQFCCSFICTYLAGNTYFCREMLSQSSYKYEAKLKSIPGHFYHQAKRF